MFLNNISTAWRNIRREKFYSALNILGLASALTCTAFIGVWMWDEWRRDRYFPNADRLVRVTGKVMMANESFEQAVTSVQVGPHMQKDYPEIAGYCRIDANEAIVEVGDQRFLEKKLLTADASFFETFNYSLQNGNPQTALSEPYTAVLTEQAAKKYFGDADPVGQTLHMNLYDRTGDGATYRITGVLAGPPRPSHFEFDILVSFASFFAYNPNYLGEDGWDESGYYTYVLLHSAGQKDALQAKMPDFFQKYLRPRWSDDANMSFDLQKISDVYLHSDRRYEIAENGDATALRIFGAVGVLILLVAGINYINMATARATKRARSIGVRKALGAQRSQLIGQFIGESTLVAMIAGALALGACSLLQPAFAYMTGKQLSVFDLAWAPWALGGAAFLLGLASGIYPAFILSGYQPVTALKDAHSEGGTGGNRLRKILATTQFAVSIALIISVIAIQGQMRFIQNKPLGYDPSAVLAVRVNGVPSVINGIEAFRTALLADSALIRGVGTSNVLLVGGTGNSSAATVDNTGKSIQTNICRMRMDAEFAATMGLKFLAGRNFSRDFPADWPTDTTQNYILNAAAVKSFGWETPEQAIGKPFRTHGRKGQVVGIVADFHFNSLKHQVEPLCIHPANGNFSQIVLRVDMARAREALGFVTAQWNSHFPDALLEYAFLDEKIENQYRSDLRFGALFSVFSIFSIFIACLGLFGLAAYSAERRTKEIGIRKVLGAGVAQIAGLLSKEFLQLVLIALGIASPIAWYFMTRWLADFAYHIDMHWSMFAGAGVVALSIACITVGFQGVKAALADPVKSLRSE